MALTVRSFDSEEEFARTALPFLLRDETENQVMASMLHGIATGRRHTKAFKLAIMLLVYDGETIVGFASQTAGYPLFVSSMSAEALEHVFTWLKNSERKVPSAFGPLKSVESFVERWTQAHGLRSRLKMHQGVYHAFGVREKLTAPGTFRWATEADVELMTAWRIAFCVECKVETETPEDAQARVRDLVAGGNRLAIWEDEGRIVSTATVGGFTPSGARVGVVYTPAEFRGRGYAGACMWELTSRLFAQGHKACYLYTDMLNPTSNGIYQRVGYDRHGESKMVDFTP